MLLGWTLGHNHNVVHAELGDGRLARGDCKVLVRSWGNVGQRETDIITMFALTH